MTRAPLFVIMGATRQRSAVLERINKMKKEKFLEWAVNEWLRVNGEVCKIACPSFGFEYTDESIAQAEAWAEEQWEQKLKEGQE